MAKISKRNKYDSPAYWTQLIQLNLHDNIKRYIEDNNLTRAEFAEKLGVSKGYVSQILNGDFDHKLSKLTELALACDLVPRLELIPKAYASQVVYGTYLQPTDWKRCNTYRRTISFESVQMKTGVFTTLSSTSTIKSASTILRDSNNWIADTKLIIPNNKIA